MTDEPDTMGPANSPVITGQPSREAQIPTDIRDSLGPAPITKFENTEAYEQLFERVAAAVSPTDYIEWMWVKDIVDLTWEANRARKARAVRLAMGRREAIERVVKLNWAPRKSLQLLSLEDLTEDDKIRVFAHKVFEAGADLPQVDLEDGKGGKQGSKAGEFNAMLSRLGLSREDVADAAYQACLDDMERLQRMIDNAISRRDTVLREIDRRREVLAKRARDALSAEDAAVNAEFEDVQSEA